ncbi:MAG TPA: hypothetical protein VMT69_11960 [Kineosporiaceae bacterium]|nr:hypothetical protein [Kineosporiaceae bacterium]
MDDTGGGAGVVLATGGAVGAVGAAVGPAAGGVVGLVAGAAVGAVTGAPDATGDGGVLVDGDLRPVRAVAADVRVGTGPRETCERLAAVSATAGDRVP